MMTVNDELERIRYAHGLTKVLSKHFPMGTKENHENLSQDSQCHG
jgi:hypothetical protein